MDRVPLMDTKEIGQLIGKIVLDLLHFVLDLRQHARHGAGHQRRGFGSLGRHRRSHTSSYAGHIAPHRRHSRRCLSSSGSNVADYTAHIDSLFRRSMESLEKPRWSRDFGHGWFCGSGNQTRVIQQILSQSGSIELSFSSVRYTRRMTVTTRGKHSHRSHGNPP